jgi:hypothetical protein
MRPRRLPLIRLLVINLAIGAAIAALMLGGLMALNPGNLRGLIIADRNGAAAFLLLGFGLVVTFGSVAMGAAIMTLGNKRKPNNNGGGTVVPVRAAARGPNSRVPHAHV